MQAWKEVYTDQLSHNGVMGSCLGAAVNVGKISAHALCAHDIIQGQLLHKWGCL